MAVEFQSDGNENYEPIPELQPEASIEIDERGLVKILFNKDMAFPPDLSELIMERRT